MANNASTGRFYAFTTDTSAPLPPSAAPPNSQYHPESSGSDSVSEDDKGAIGHSYPVERTVQGQGIFHEPFGAQDVSGFPQDRLDPASATIYLDDASYIATGLFRTHPASNYIQAVPDVPFPSLYDNFNPAMPNPMTSTTVPDTSFSHDSGDSSPAGSNGSGESPGNGHLSGSSQGSASTGALSHDSHGRETLYQGESGPAPLQRFGHLPSYPQEHYPAYDEYNNRIGMEHAHLDTDPRQPENAYYRPRTNTYPPMEAYGIAPDIGSPQHTQTSLYSSPDLHMMPTQPDDISYDHDAHNDPVIPGQTQIELPPAPTPRHDAPFAGSSSVIYSGDDACYQCDEEEIRRLVGLADNEEISLQALADPPDGRRPGHSIPLLSQLAILGSPNRRLTLQEIYRTLEERFEWFRVNKHDKSWQNSIRHNLSLYKCFRRVSKPITEPGKGSYWMVDYTAGAGTKRPRKRNKVAKKDTATGQSQDQSQVDHVESESAVSYGDRRYFKPSSPPSSFIKPIPTELRYRSYPPSEVNNRTLSSRIESDYRKRHPTAAPYPQQNTRASARSPGSGHTRASRPSASNRPMMDQGSAPGMRPPSDSYGGRPAFGQPSMGQPAFSQAPVLDHPVSAPRLSPIPWPAPMTGSGQSLHHSQSLQFRPPSHSLSIDHLPPLQNVRPRASAARSSTLPANIAYELRNPQYTLPPPRHMFEQARTDDGRFVSERSYNEQPPAQYDPPTFVQGSSRGGRRETPSSEESSHE